MNKKEYNYAEQKVWEMLEELQKFCREHKEELHNINIFVQVSTEKRNLASLPGISKKLPR